MARRLKYGSLEVDVGGRKASQRTRELRKKQEAEMRERIFAASDTDKARKAGRTGDYSSRSAIDKMMTDYVDSVTHGKLRWDAGKEAAVGDGVEIPYKGPGPYNISDYSGGDNIYEEGDQLAKMVLDGNMSEEQAGAALAGYEQTANEEELRLWLDSVDEESMFEGISNHVAPKRLVRVRNLGPTFVREHFRYTKGKSRFTPVVAHQRRPSHRFVMRRVG